MESHFHRGLKTFKVAMKLFRKNRERLCENLRAKSDKKGAFVLLQGGESETFHCTDREILFRQEAFFHWAFGVEEPDCLGVIDVENAKSTLFVPRLPESYGIWLGKILSTNDFKKKYAVDNVQYVDEIETFFKDLKPNLIHLVEGLNSDSGNTSKPASFKGIENYKTDKKTMFNEICELRVIKTPEELEVIAYANEVSSEAHKRVMRAIKPGMTEYQCESLFLHHCYSEGGARHVCYTCIAGTGDNSSILHYGHSAAPNTRTMEDGDMALFDMGCEYYCYCSDITCSFPINGRFTEKQRLVYTAVYEANQAVMKTAKPGVSWLDMHLLAERVILTHLRDGGLLKGDIDEMIEARLGYIFMPHGLGHFLGIDTHDVGGYLDFCPPRSDKPGLKSLRTARVLKENMVITIEPGCYFIDILLDQALKDPVHSKFLNPDVLNGYRKFGGVRIEDDVVITSNGCKNLTKVPRTIDEIESWMAGGK